MAGVMWTTAADAERVLLTANYLIHLQRALWRGVFIWVFWWFHHMGLTLGILVSWGLRHRLLWF